MLIVHDNTDAQGPGRNIQERQSPMLFPTILIGASSIARKPKKRLNFTLGLPLTVVLHLIPDFGLYLQLLYIHVRCLVHVVMHEYLRIVWLYPEHYHSNSP